MAFDEEHPHAVGQDFFDDGNFLREQRPGREAGEREYEETSRPGICCGRHKQDGFCALDELGGDKLDGQGFGARKKAG